jgi:tetratricopeptide (TPR) repeat protein
MLGSLAILFGCSVEKNTRSSRFFQSLTSRYNIYFNGNESFKTGVDKVNSGYTDDYSSPLKIFEYSDPATVSVCSSDMERAIQKASKVISLKSITAKPETKGNDLPTQKDEEFLNRKEYNEWVDDSYLLMGKARIYKHDFESAKSTLSYAASSTVDNNIKTEATIWLARGYNETGNFNESSRVLNELDLSKSFPKELKGMYYTTLADLFMKQKRYSEVIEPLEKSLQFISGKRNKYRLTYLLAQMCEKTGDGNKATSFYRAVVRMNPPYEVEFNARINLAGVFDLNSGNPSAIRKELLRMLRDSKNKEFRDQIYYALGNLSKKEGKEQEAVEYYKKSAAASTMNQNQRGKSFLALAEYYFSKPDYLNSGKYYDSTISFLDTKYPDYQSVKSKALNLNSLVVNLLIIEREDSLQRVAQMSPAERTSLIASIIEKVKQDEVTAKSGNENTDRYNLGQYYENERRFEGNIAQEGKWYFYNQSALTFGRTEFRRRWGDRKLEDNWRRLNKSRLAQNQISGNQEENGQVKTDSASKIMDNKKPEFYLLNLPVNDSLKKISDEKIANALLEAGKIYHEKFLDNPKAVESFEYLMKRYPNNELEPEALYNTYKVFREENNPRSETYRQRLLEKYPSNEFSRILSDPDYYNKKMEELRQAEKLYVAAYEAYQKENFTEAMSISDNALAQYPKHELAPKFMLLRDYCIARTSDERTFKNELNRLIKLWPETEEAKRASEIIAWLNQEIPHLKVEEDKQVAKEIYREEKSSPHTFALIIQDTGFNLNQATFDVISYNIDNYSNQNYRTQGSLVENKYIMILVSGFADLKSALDYYNAFDIARAVRNPSGSKMMSFIIGKTNLDVLNNDKNPERYRLYFNENYLSREDKK